MISENLREVRQEIQKSCALVSRSEDEVTLVAVTKTVNEEFTRQIVAAGVLDLAENRSDKFLLKKQLLADIPDIRWHFIGNLQRRKVKSIVNEIDFLHSLDNLKLANEIQKHAQKPLKCFVEVNVSGEASKHGLPPALVGEFIEDLAKFDKIKVVGLMTMAPFDSTEGQQRAIFKELRQLQLKIAAKKAPWAPCQELSMGMSNDYPAAILEHATFVRIGTALFRD